MCKKQENKNKENPLSGGTEVLNNNVNTVFIAILTMGGGDSGNIVIFYWNITSFKVNCTSYLGFFFYCWGVDGQKKEMKKISKDMNWNMERIEIQDSRSSIVIT